MYFTFQIANKKGADQTARMPRLVCTFVVCEEQSQGFSGRDPYDVEGLRLAMRLEFISR